MQQKIRNIHDIPVSYIQTTQFKNMNITLYFQAALNAEAATKRHLMASMMQAKNRVYKNRQAVQETCEMLYGLMFSASTTKIGTQHLIKVTVRFVNPKYIDDPSYLSQVLSFLTSMLYDVDFDAATLNEEKRFLHDFFNAEYANKSRYAATRYLKHLYDQHPYKTHPFGKQALIDAVSLADIKTAHGAMLNQNPSFITVSGDFDETTLHASLKKHINHTAHPLNDDVFVRHDFTKKQDITETMNLSQDRLFMTLKTDVYYHDALFYPMQVMNALFGESSESKLFLTVREQASLAYYIHAQYAPFSGLITISSGMKHTHIEAAKTLIIKALEDVQNGVFSDHDLIIAKNYLTTHIKQSYDSVNALSVKALKTALLNTPFSETEALNAIQAVGKEDVMTAAQQAKHLFTYVLSGANNHENQTLSKRQ